MAVDPDQFFASAKSIFDGSDTEISARNSASRAYYYAFHLARQLSDRLPNTIVGAGGVHETLIRKLNGLPYSHSAALKCRSVGYQLALFRKTRTKADYDLGIDFLRSEAEALLLNIPRFVATVEEALDLFKK